MRHHYTNPVSSLTLKDCQALLDLAILEDAPEGDPTSESIFDESQRASAHLIPREEGIFCAKSVSELLVQRFQTLTGYSIHLQSDLEDGKAFQAGQRLMTMQGSLRGILRLERPFLNFAQYLSGIATTVNRAVQEAGEGIEILDTRKTLPGYRRLAKYAVYCGGGTNHRIHLSDMAMIKDNHVHASGSITSAVSSIRKKHPGLPIDLEIDSLDQLDEALNQSPEVLLLDNMNAEQIRQAAIRIRAKSPETRIEVSGGWTPAMLSDLKDVGPLGVSMGYITHTTRFLDLSLEIQ
ncbi:MAG: carboxylating nicotinate-nucleotide diphosphorylase [Leptospiraceae bacterium]|nr:carboxylating nicotinate-nucleotide diphosphorylase [Leptospiraceae bacterium]